MVVDHSLLHGLEAHLDLLPQILEMDQLLKGAQLVSLDLIQGQEAFGSPPGQFDGLDFLLAEAVLDAIFFDLSLAFLFGGVVAGIDDEIVLAGDAGALHIVLEDLLQVEVQSHEVAQGLLTEQSLGLHVDLSDRLAGQAFGVYDFFPFSHPEFHEGQFEDGHLFALPPRGEGVVPEAFGLVVLDAFGHTAK